MDDLAGKVAFVTGGTSGIGLAIVRACAAAGMKVAFTYRREESRHAALADLARPGFVVHPVRADVTDRAAMQHAALETHATFGNVHVLCNCAGVNLLGPVDEATFDDWDWVMGVNVQGVINTLMGFLPGMKAHGQGGHVLNVASMSAFTATPRSGVYATSKFALRGLTESLRYALVRHHIGVSLVCPGLTQSNIWEAPLRRPQAAGQPAAAPGAALLKRLAEIHAVGMDADEVARKVLAGMRRGDFYIFSHSEFRDEIRELSEEVLAAFPEESADPRRVAFEEWRRSTVRAAAELLKAGRARNGVADEPR
jgi:NAD(P)-dependent dehydrogenase (short-subunit alcohol dehydrogenase family)